MASNTTPAQDRVIAQVDDHQDIGDLLISLREIIEELDEKLDKAKNRIEELEN